MRTLSVCEETRINFYYNHTLYLAISLQAIDEQNKSLKISKYNIYRYKILIKTLN